MTAEMWTYIGIVLGYSGFVWLAAEALGRTIGGEGKGGKIALAVALLMGPLGGLALHGVGWLRIPGDPDPRWEWVMAGLTGLLCTVGASAGINELFNRLRPGGKE